MLHPGLPGQGTARRSRAESLVLPPAVQPPARHLGSRSGAARTERRAHGADDPPRVDLRPAAARAPSQFGADRRRRTGDPPAKLGQLHRPPRAVRQRDRRSALHREPAPHVSGPRLGRAYAAHRRLPRSHGLLRFEPPAQRGACALLRGRRQPHRHDPRVGLRPQGRTSLAAGRRRHRLARFPPPPAGFRLQGSLHARSPRRGDRHAR